MQARKDDDLRGQIEAYLRAHHTMTIATTDPQGNSPHAATVFYAVDPALNLVFLSKPTSVHGSHIGQAGPVAVTVSEGYEDWEAIQGVQVWGEARLLAGAARAGAFATYVRRFPFVRDLMSRSALSEVIRDIGVYRVEPRRVAFTDNSAGVFGRKMLELMGQ